MEQGVATATMAVADMETQPRQVVMGLTKAVEAATKNADTCHALSVTTKRLLNNHEVVSTQVAAIESSVDNLSTRISSLEGVIGDERVGGE